MENKLKIGDIRYFKYEFLDKFVPGVVIGYKNVAKNNVIDFGKNKYSKYLASDVTEYSLFTGTNPEADIYYSNKITITKLFKLAEELDVIPEPINLEKAYRFKTQELKHLKENLHCRAKQLTLPILKLMNEQNLFVYLL